MSRKEIFKYFEEQKAFMQDKVASGIEQYRKGRANLVIKDENGNPVKGAEITVNQASHEFKFGANLFMLDELETDEKNEAYKKHFAETFNMATLPFYWDTLEPEKGKQRYDKNSPKSYRRPPIDLCMEFCEKHSIEPREHALAYDHFFPKWLKDASVHEVKCELQRRYKEISERYAAKIPTIEVTNEMDWSKGTTVFYEEPDYVEWCFKTAEKYFPANQLVVNEWTGDVWERNATVYDRYYAYVEASMLKGVRIDAIGMQYHVFVPREDEINHIQKLYNPSHLYKAMDLYARFGKPLQVTEVTLPAYSYDAEDEEIQSRLLENLYSIWFSHPNMEQIVYWNLVDGYAYVSDPSLIATSQGDMTLGENYYHGGLLRFDMSPKPAYHKLKELISEKWHTKESFTTNADGKAMFKGFFGKYDVEIEFGGKTYKKQLNLSKKGYKDFEIVL